ncbi:uncharacterized protein LOC115360795 [Myripristis murdjan]|uniref:Uncharacterized LOC115360795 n=1 Tax=Myripristis murdjan TaxID=586833 RepID=A0A668AC87_9TELE|nr:uncharacterized protein LOC115360795 [Myripristis murdjan]XP_029909804.1 uncharacterized protein LOC115360795 [Myripristis murdjan]
MAAVDDVEESEEFRLLEAYCAKRTQQRLHPSIDSDLCLRGLVQFESGGAGIRSSDENQNSLWNRFRMNFMRTASENDEPGVRSASAAGLINVTQLCVDTLEEQGADASLSGVADKLIHLADSAVVLEEALTRDELDGKDEIIQKLVELLKKSGDVMDKKIKENKVFQQQLQTNFNYALYERLISSLQSMVDVGPASGAARCEDRIERQKIVWAFEVTSRLSTMDIIPRRRFLGFAERYLRMHHSAWVQQRGGWEKAFESDDID